jgi:tRNA(fMet)-specific endonuclease VapC
MAGRLRAHAARGFRAERSPVIYVLDSNAWIVVLRRKSAALLDELKRRPSNDIVLCSVVLAELWYGVCRSAPEQRAKNEALIHELRTQYASIHFDDDAAIDCAELRSYLATQGQPIGPNDLMIAAIARTRGLTLVTHNTAEFSRVPGLMVEDWQNP